MTTRMDKTESDQEQTQEQKTKGNNMVKLYPIKTDIKIHVTDEDRQNGTVTIEGGCQRIPTDSELETYLKKAIDALPDGFRLMTRHESETFCMREKLGNSAPVMALSKLKDGEEWHDPATANTFYFEETIDDEDFD